ncbi:hypothetical protein EVAR_64635_1 [Eumeta japonica]|uniref:Uncharacterized protein n=1 Tax=Eumeta variegata TaxID=151549 RepID=A0A4C1ZAK4_EUMVA|nr:hypothetical protein EVAR_64635_1 [Eumeta japonica]
MQRSYHVEICVLHSLFWETDVLLFPEEGWARSASSSHWTLQPCWWRRSRCKVVEVAGTRRIGIEIQKMKELFGPGFVQIGTGGGIKIKKGMRNRIGNGIRSESRAGLGPKLRTALGSKTNVRSGSESKARSESILSPIKIKMNKFILIHAGEAAFTK